NSFGPATATVRVWVNGVLQLTTQHLLTENQTWHAAQAVISNNGKDITVQASNDALGRASGCIN
ncbi:MAG: hypothetical protein JST92_25640, partial [Deltaproteobacteria bacterium]|nr:hypothetical protein [Deltaproteobacteria bacterium]